MGWERGSRGSESGKSSPCETTSEAGVDNHQGDHEARVDAPRRVTEARVDAPYALCSDREARVPPCPMQGCLRRPVGFSPAAPAGRGGSLSRAG